MNNASQDAKGPTEPAISPSTDFHAFVLSSLSRMTRSTGAVDQAGIRRCFGLASSYLVTDTTMNMEGGLNTWYTGFTRLVDVLVALHGRGELELETLLLTLPVLLRGHPLFLIVLDDVDDVHPSYPISMDTERPPRPRRPTRDLPAAPVPASSTHSVQSDQAFSTPLSSPAQLNHPLADSPTSEHGTYAFPERNDHPPQESASSPQDQATALTPLRAHYLKKELIQLQFRREFRALLDVPNSNVSTFAYLGPPFSPPPKDGPRLDLPFLRYIFRQFVLSFPFLAAAPKNFFPDKLQPFLASLLSRNLSSVSVMDDNPENSEEMARFKVLVKLERNFTMLMTSGTKLAEKEEVVRLTQTDLDRLERLARKRAAKEAKNEGLFEVNVVCVRTVVEKGRMRSKAHEEFIVRTRRSHFQDVFVSRRYGDFKTLSDELRKAHPSEDIPPPPAKDRAFVNVNSPTLSPASPASPRMSTSRSNRPYNNIPGSYGSNASLDSIQSSPGSPTVGSSTNGAGPSAAPLHPSKLAREKNRLTLRSYLHTLLSSSTLASSPVLKSFLLSDPTRLSEEELEDSRRREEADRVRDDGRKRFAQEIKGRVEGLRDAVRSVKGELLGKDGLTHIFATIKRTPDVRNLPENYHAVLEWARISLASTVFQHFIAADSASESFAGLKRIHGLMPYFMLKTALKISNPMAMIRGVLDLFMATPFGGRSLLQRMFTGSLVEETKVLEEDIEAVKAKVEDPALCEKVRLFVYAPREIQAIFKADAAAEGINVLTIVLRSADQPILTRPQIQRVMKAHHAHREYVKYCESLDDSDDDSGPKNDDAWLYEDLIVLAKLYSRLKDREQLIALIFEGTTADLLKDIITIFYAPLAQVYRAASIADSLGDMQNFITDLIRTVEQCEELSQQDPARTVQMFVDLIQRHEQSFYHFVHKVHSKGEGLFTSLMQWIELFLTLMREGLGQPVSLEFLLPHVGPEREAIMKEIDDVARYHYKLKLAYEAKVRRRFGRTQGRNDADAEDEAAAQLVNGVVEDLSFGDLVKGDADDLAAEQTDSDETEESSSGSDSDEDDSSDEDSSDEDDSGSEESDSAESVSGSSTEGGAQTPSSNRQPTPIARSATIGHSPRYPQSPARTPSSAGRPHQSMDLPLEARPPITPSSSGLQRSMTLDSSSTKDLPPLPPNASPSSPGRVREQLKSRPAGSPNSEPKKRKADGPKPPTLQHVPRLLPLFVEMMRPLLRPQASPVQG
ncbi:hypothetical protein EIP91_006714 [Steccherinum ochraceum]|uniref:PX domain-containing protein n=1 Tax=Steccherinum ochraceum TaxID=92696 RepID=A0A4V2MXD2_9APHY|nr:hypothetical protein EIP91_006714 [Steccherinum ochraceum]